MNSDVKNVLTLLTKLLKFYTDKSLNFEHFQSSSSEDTADTRESFWTVLNILSSHALKNTKPKIIYPKFDSITMTKLNFAHLGYSSIDFFAFNHNSKDLRPLLIALSWLIASQRVLDSIVELKIIESHLGQEFTTPPKGPADVEKSMAEDVLSSSNDPTNIIIHKANKLSNNFKEIIELSTQKALLLSKIHEISNHNRGIRHLNALDFLLIKEQYSEEKKSIFFEKNTEILQDLQKITTLINSHIKWTTKEHIFFNWMETILNDFTSNFESFSTENAQELSNFISVLRGVYKFSLNSPSETVKTIIPCVSRIVQAEKSKSNSSEWQKKFEKDLKVSEDELCDKIKILSMELKLLLKLIPNCLQI